MDDTFWTVRLCKLPGVAPVSHPLSVCPVLELPDGMLPPVVIPAARRELACLILLSISYSGKKTGGGKGYTDENPSWRTWAGLCCNTLFPLLSRISPTWSLKMLPWVAQPQTAVIIASKSFVGVTGFNLLLAAWSLGYKPQSMGLLLWDSSMSRFPEKDHLFSKVFSLTL